jgi:hypothetical protein
MVYECNYCLKQFEVVDDCRCPQCGGKESRPVSELSEDDDDPLTRSEKVVIRQFGTMDVGCNCQVDFTQLPTNQ